MLQVSGLAPSRPPCSAAENDAARWLAARLRRFGLRPSLEPVRAPTSPTWVPLLRALLRVWAAAFMAAGWETVAGSLAALSLAGGVSSLAGLVRFLPAVGAVSNNVVAVRRGSESGARPLVVVAHLDTHPAAHSPPSRIQSVGAALSAGLALLAATAGRSTIGSAWRMLAAAVAVEGALQIAWFARRELETPRTSPDDNTSGLYALGRLAERLSGTRPARDTWLVGTCAGTAGNHGIVALLRSRPALRRAAWVVEIDALGRGEVVAVPFPARFPYPGTPPSLVRAIESAARDSGDPLQVRRLRRSHSDARAALRQRTPAICITGGLDPPAAEAGHAYVANAERVAVVLASLARTRYGA